MDKNSKTDWKKKQKKWSCENRSPLQDLNVIPKCNTKSSSFSSSMSISSSSSSSSCSSFSSRTPCHKMPSATLQKPKKIPPLRSKLTKKNDLPRPISKKPKKIPPLLSGKKPNLQKSNLSNVVKKPACGSERYGVKPKRFNQKEVKKGSGEHIQLLDLDSNFTSSENCTPFGKLAATVSGIDCEHFEHTESSNTTGNSIKTPPIEASVSPEIQCGVSSVLVSAATPCYAAGHVLSGVTDKRKCRPRGILTIGTTVDWSECENPSGSEDRKCEGTDRNMGVRKSGRVSLIPLPAEASMHWLLSPCRENNDISEGGSVSDFRMLTGSATSVLPYSTSTCSEVASDLVHNGGKYSDSVNRDVARSGGKTRMVLLSSGSPELKDSSMGRNLFPASPLAKSCCNDGKVPDEWKCSCSLVRESSPCSTTSLSSGNVIHTPKSDSISGKCGGFSWLHSGDHGDNCGSELDGDNCVSELDSVAEFLQKTKLSPTNQKSAWDLPKHHFKFSSTSWVSDSTLDNVSQSQMRISWRDGIVSRIFETDDLDCCRCLSDDEDGGYCYTNPKTNVDVESSAHEENDLLPESGLRSPEFLEHKHKLYRKGKLKSPPPEANMCAESILTEGGGLVSSADSDWSLCNKNQLFQV